MHHRAKKGPTTQCEWKRNASSEGVGMGKGVTTEVPGLHGTLAGRALRVDVHRPAATAELLVSGASHGAVGSGEGRTSAVHETVAAVAFTTIFDTCHAESPIIAGLHAPVNSHKIRVEREGGQSALGVIRETPGSGPSSRNTGDGRCRRRRSGGNGGGDEDVGSGRVKR